jgi:hypothetical protein
MTLMVLCKHFNYIQEPTSFILRSDSTRAATSGCLVSWELSGAMSAATHNVTVPKILNENIVRYCNTHGKAFHQI